MVDNAKSLAAIERLESIYKIIEGYGLAKYVSFDLGMLSKFHYYTGVLFKAYTYGVGDAIVKGGRYDNLLGSFGKESPAVGFVFLVDDILNAYKAQKISSSVSFDETWVVYRKEQTEKAFEKMKLWRQEGKRVVAILHDGNKSREAYCAEAEKNQVKDVNFDYF